MATLDQHDGTSVVADVAMRRHLGPRRAQRAYELLGHGVGEPDARLLYEDGPVERALGVT